ncbi:MAG: proline iminopeptidase-family hydrolase [Oscillospiraceae bacterium]|nr:proline iminopeptidase-family hydrolase [Oscillospiraceae bacterium]
MMMDGYITYLKHNSYYRMVGPLKSRKPPLLMLHGGPGSTHNYFEVLDRLAEEDGRQLISYDQIGCGNSYLDGQPELWTMETWIGELKAVRKALNLEEVVLLGQSWGGMLLLEYMCRHEHNGVKGIILSSTLPSSRLWGEEQARMIRQLPAEMQEVIRDATERNDYSSKAYQQAEALYMELHASGKPDPDAPECLMREKRLGRESYFTAWGPNEFSPMGTLKDYDVTELLPSIDVPALIISGGNDLCTPFIAKTMYDLIPNAQWELFRDCRHACFVEDTERYIQLLKTWLNQEIHA